MTFTSDVLISLGMMSASEAFSQVIVIQHTSASNKIFLMKKLFNLKMADSKSVIEHLNELNTQAS